MPGVGEVVGGSLREERLTVLQDKLTRCVYIHSSARTILPEPHLIAGFFFSIDLEYWTSISGKCY